MPFKKSFKKRSSKFRSRIAPRRTRWRGKWRLRRGFDITKLSKNVVSVGTIRPDRIMVKLPYETTVQLTGAITVDHIMNTNSLFDPIELVLVTNLWVLILGLSFTIVTLFMVYHMILSMLIPMPLM